MPLKLHSAPLRSVLLRQMYKDGLIHKTHDLLQDQALYTVQTEAFGKVQVPSEWRNEGIPVPRPSLASLEWGAPAGLGPPAGTGAQDSGEVCEEAGRNTCGHHRLCGIIRSNYKTPKRKSEVTEREELGLEEISANHHI